MITKPRLPIRDAVVYNDTTIGTPKPTPPYRIPPYKRRRYPRDAIIRSKPWSVSKGKLVPLKNKYPLKRHLGIPKKHKIPVTLLKKIKGAREGSIIRNPTKTGKPIIKVTKLLKKRAIATLNLRKRR